MSPAPPADGGTGMRAWIGPLGLAAVLIGVLAGAAAGARSPAGQGLALLAAGGLAVYLAAAFPRLAGKSRFFVLAGLAMAGLTLTRPDAPARILEAMGRAGFVATLYVALGFLRDAAETSPLVRRCGRFLAGQPPGRRYLALTAGGHVFGLIVNFGVISLLGTMAVGATAGDDTWRGRLRRRRMLSAVHRGFCGILCWSPLTVSLAVVMASLPSLRWEDAVPWLLGSAGLMMAIGWGFDRAIRPPRPPGTPAPPPPAGSWALTLPVIGIVALVFAAGAAWQAASGVGLAIGVMSATPWVAFAWWLAQADGLPPPARAAAALARLGRHVRDTFPRYGNEVALLATAAFIGSLLGAFVPGEAVAAALRALPLPPWALAAAMMWLVVGLGQAGMNPVLSVMILTAALPGPEALHLAPEVLAVALTAGWALTAGTSPFSAAPLVAGSLAGVPAAEVGRRWNGPWALACLVVLTGWIACVALLAGP